MANDSSIIDEKQLANVIASFVERATDKLVEAVSDGVKGATAQMRFAFRAGFSNYLKAIVARHSTIKTLLHRDDPQYIYSFYVPLDLKSEAKKQILSVSIMDLLKHGNFHLICGTGGSGKSMLSRHLLISTVHLTNKLPIIIDLRALNGKGIPDLVKVIRDTVAENQLDLAVENLERAFEKGLIALFLDGFDEVEREIRDSVRQQILAIAERYQSSAFIITSRPHDEFVSWSRFVQWRPQPLTKDKAYQLVEKLQYDGEIKARFLRDLKERLYDQQPTFVSNPLLLTIMLISYSVNADVPAKRHLFYSQAFEALWNRHDAMKGGYRRQRATALAMDDFVAVLAAFSMQTYFGSKIQFTKEQCVRSVVMASKAVSIQVDAESFVDDLVSCLCLLVQDGPLLGFAHRSFQEYYAAVFTLRTTRTERDKLWDMLFRRSEQDAVCKLIYEMNRELIEEEAIVPKLDRVAVQLGYAGVRSGDVIVKYIRHVCSEVIIDKDVVHYELSPAGEVVVNVVAFAHRLYMTNKSASIELELMEKSNAPRDYSKLLGGKDERVVTMSEFPTVAAALSESYMTNIHLASGLFVAMDAIPELKKRAMVRAEGLRSLLDGM